MDRIELLWQERNNETNNPNSYVYGIEEFLGLVNKKEEDNEINE